MWLVCYERFLSSKETLPIESSVEFIFSRCEELDFPKEVYNFIVEKGDSKTTPKWRGLSLDKVRTAPESDKDFIMDTKNSSRIC